MSNTVEKDELYDNLYTDGEDRRPKLLLIILGIVALVFIIFISFFACSKVNKKSDNNFLQSITISGGSLSPNFSKSVFEYFATVDGEFTTVSCKTESSKANTEGCNKRIYLTEECVPHTIKVVSQAGNKREYKLNICKQDKNAPVIKNVVMTPEGYSKDKVTLTIEVDSVNELASEAYSFDGGSTWQKSNTYVVTENGSVEIKVKDIKNNVSASFTKEIDKIDKTVPKVSVKGSIGSGVSTSSNVELTAVIDPISTESGYQYQWYRNDTLIQKATSNSYLATSSGNYKVRVTTGSGNSTVSGIYKVNKISTGGGSTTTKPKPSNNYKLLINGVSGNAQNWTKGPVTLKISATASNGLHGEAYSFDGGSTWQKSNSKSFNSNSNVSIVVRDKKGNKTDTYIIYITKIDNIKPSVSINGGTSIGNKLTAKINPSSIPSGVKYQWYKNGNLISGATSSSYTPTSAGSYQVRVTTGTGNSTISSKHTISQAIPGTVSISGSTTNGVWTNKNVVLTARVSNATANKYEWYKGTVKVATTTSNSYTVTTDVNAEYKVVAYFSNGTQATSGTWLVKLDKTPPTKTTVKFTAGGKTYNPDGTQWTNQPITREFKSSDSGSGIKYFEYSYTCGTGSDGNEGEGKYSFENYHYEGINVACHRAVDYAGNKGEWSSKNYMKIDITPPYTPRPTLGNGQTISCQEEGSSSIMSLSSKTKKNLLCIATTTASAHNFNFNVKREDNEGGSGIGLCKIVWNLDENDRCKQYGSRGNLKASLSNNNKTFNKLENINSITWSEDHSNKCLTGDELIYVIKCYDKAGNEGNILFLGAAVFE